MTPAQLLTDGFDRVRQGVEDVLSTTDGALLAVRPRPTANSLAWLVWHLTRVQDDHIAGVARVEQVWTRQGFADRFALPFPASDIGYGHGSEQVAQVQAPATLLREYFGATHEQTTQYLESVAEADLDAVVDTQWDPPVTLGVRLVSVLNDCTQHVGQAAYLRGLLDS